MINIMLVGAWFLIQQHCCVADAVPSPRNVMVDPLMRRSPLEKNFIRFGRSWPLNQSVHSNRLTFNEFNKMFTDKSVKPMLKETSDGKGNVMNYSDGAEPSPVDDMSRKPQKGPILNKMIERKEEKDRFVDQMMPRTIRSKQGFIRFGRSGSLFSKNKKYSGLNKDNFIRFGRRAAHNSIEIQKIDEGETIGAVSSIVSEKDKKKTSGKNAGFIRFGKRVQPTEEDKMKRFIPNSRVSSSCGICRFRSAFKFDPTSLIAPELLLPRTHFSPSPVKTDFIRFG